jgi:2-hydroxychromene-2-carboxylate isomerase
MSPPEIDAAFYFDLASPLAYLAAEQMLDGLGAPARWQPVLARELPHGERFESFRCAAETDAFHEDVQRRARALGLQPLQWPATFPFDSQPAMLAATYAQQIGRAVPFAQAAFRQAFAGGHDLANLDFVCIAAAACEMHPRAVLAAVEREATAEQLRAATATAAAAGVRDVPAVRVGAEVFHGEPAIAQARAALGATTMPAGR